MVLFIQNNRYKQCNILSLELDMPTRTTRDYEEPIIHPLVQCSIDKAVREEDIVDGRMTENRPEKIDFTKLSKVKNPSIDRRDKKKKEELYPSTRGLISNPVRFV